MSVCPYAAALAAEPQIHYRALPPLSWDSAWQCWVVATPQLVREALLNVDLGVRPADEPVPAALLDTPMAPLYAGLARMRDGEEHRALKAALQRALASCDDTLIQQTAAQCAARLAPKASEAAAITRFNYGLPVCTLGALLGLPEAQWQPVIDDSLDFVRCIAPGGTPQQLARGITAAQRLCAQLAAANGVLRQALVREIGDARLVSANALGLLFQACEATAGWIGQAYWLARRGADVDAALERVRALTPPIQNTRRFVLRETQLGGCTLHVGQTVLLVLGADGELAFGAGAHCC
ncbi:cytochrome P450, partial [Serratia marcescens]|uniref:cytochrome P450 n=1 Tax=Serratia marcescens TaxID=615 RepID=UPI0011E80137